MPDSIKPIDKSNLPSRHVSVGPEKAPHRSYYYAMGMTEEEINQPLVGVVSTWNEAAPCNIALARQAQAAKRGVREHAGTPREFTTITVTDGIAMGHAGMKSSLVSREVIADSIELTVRGHCYDAVVGLAGCDKSLPGVMMAMARLNVPSVFMYGGSILPGRFKDKDVTVQDVLKLLARMLPAICLMKICTSWNALPAQAQGHVAASLPPTQWRVFPRRLALPFQVQQAHQHHTSRVTNMPIIQAAS